MTSPPVAKSINESIKDAAASGVQLVART